MPIILDGTLGITTPALTVTGASTYTGDISTAGNLIFTTTGDRIIGDMSNGTVANRLAFQTSTADSSTVLHIIPSGTSTTASLELNNNSTPTNSSTLQFVAGATTTNIRSATRGTGTYLPMIFETSGSERMRIDTSGNVGIGTSSPAYKLQVRRAGGVASLGIQLDNTVGFTRDVQYYSVADSTSDTTGHAFYVRNGTATDNLAMRIDSTGNVGIGTSSPTDNLYISRSTNAAGGISVVNTNNAQASQIAQLYLQGGDNAYAQIKLQANSVNSSIRGNSDGSLAFLSSTTERMRIDSSGYVTMPYQPAFRAFTATSFTGSTVVIFGSTQFNTGGHYSTSTGRFTAPIAGRYFFTFYLLSAGGYTGDFWGGLRKNGSSLAYAEIDWPGDYRTIATSTVVQLAAGDYVDVIIAQGNTYAGGGDGEWSAFSGYLIG
jgi:hypothetical protein